MKVGGPADLLALTEAVALEEEVATTLAPGVVVEEMLAAAVGVTRAVPEDVTEA